MEMIKEEYSSESCLVSSVAQSVKANVLPCANSTRVAGFYRLCSVDFYPHLLGNLTLCWTMGTYMTEIGRLLIKDGGIRRDVLESLSVFILTGKSVLQWLLGFRNPSKLQLKLLQSHVACKDQKACTMHNSILVSFFYTVKYEGY